MKQKNPLNLTDWDDFEVFHNESKITDAKRYYQSYLEFTELVKTLPKSELKRRGWISSKDDLASLSPLLEMIHASNFGALFRKHSLSNKALWLAWLSKVTTLAKLAALNKDIRDYKELTNSDLTEIAQFSAKVSNIKLMPDILAQKGIVLIYEKALPRMKLDGVVFHLESNHPVIGLSFRYSRLDNYWFTLMHELAHIKLHYDKLQNPIFYDLDDSDCDLLEAQANRLAKNSLIKKSTWRTCKAKYSRNEKDIISFAKDVGIHPAIVAGMLQKEQNAFDRYRKIVDKINTRREIFEDE